MCCINQFLLYFRISQQTLDVSAMIQCLVEKSSNLWMKLYVSISSGRGCWTLQRSLSVYVIASFQLYILSLLCRLILFCLHCVCFCSFLSDFLSVLFLYFYVFFCQYLLTGNGYRTVSYWILCSFQSLSFRTLILSQLYLIPRQ